MAKMDLSQFNIDKNKTILDKSLNIENFVEQGRGDNKKVGRPTFQQEGIEYTALTIKVPVETKKKVMQALSGRFYNQYKTQAELINDAILKFIEK